MSRSPATVTFLGTGAAGGTPGTGRSRRMESSAVVRDGATSILVDVTRDAQRQLAGIDRLDAVVLTHGHADAIGGLARLRRWCRERGFGPLPAYASPATIDAARRRFRRLDHLRFVPTGPGEEHTAGSIRLAATEVPHATNPRRFPTYAWRLGGPSGAVTYASDVARLDPSLERLAAGADLLIADGATLGRSIPNHLRIDRDLPVLCRWPVRRIALTQIGRAVPPHPRLETIVDGLCDRAFPAYDGLVVPFGD